MKPARWCWSALLACALAHAADYRLIPGGELRTALPAQNSATVMVAPYRLRALPVTRAEFERFVRQQPQWQRGHVPAVFADGNYLSDWTGDADAGALNRQAPVTWVSWYAARAYCASEGATLPSWAQWEFAASADATRRDARGDPAWRQRILSWYAHPQAPTLPAVGGEANLYGIANLHQLIFEWVEDFNGLFVTSDSRSQGESKTMETCGAAALSLADKENYAILMRIALLASLDGRDSMGSLGLRCVQTVNPAAPPSK